MRKKIILTAVFIAFFISYTIAQTNLTADVYSSYFGSPADEENVFIAVDKSGNIILAGHTNSTAFKMVSAFQPQSGGGLSDAFITKFNPDMTQILFSTYLGGSGYDEIKGIDVDDAGNIYVTGMTNSRNFPISNNTYDNSYNGDAYDAFLTQVSSDGQLLYSTLIGGNNEDVVMGISVVDSTSIYIVGFTKSTDFPVKLAYLATYKGGYDGFIVKFDIQNNTIDFSSYMGGTRDDMALSVKADKSGNVYVGGLTKSENFPVKNAYQSVHAGGDDAIIFKMDSNGALVYSTLVGSPGDEGAYIDINNKNEVYFTCGSSNSTMTCSPNAFSPVIGGMDLIIGKLSAGGDSLLYFSFFGGSNLDYGKLIRVIGDEKIAITGITASSNFPVSTAAYDTKQLKNEIFFSILDLDKKEIQYSTYLGGKENDAVFGMCIKNDSTIIFGGTSSSNDFPVSSNAFTKSFQGVTDAVVVKFKFKLNIPTSINTGTKSNKINVYPSPTMGQINLNFGKNTAQHSFVEIYNLQGNLLFSSTVQNTSNSTINLSNYPKGLYMLKLMCAGEIHIEKICLK